MITFIPNPWHIVNNMLHRLRPLASFLMDNNIIFDIRNYIESKYPKLTLDEIDLIASDIQRRYDYAPIESQVEERLQECAYYANINLDGKNNTNDSQFDDDSVDEGLVHSSEGC